MGTSSIMKLLRLFVGGLLLAAVQASNDLDTATSTLWNRVLQNIDSNNTSGSLSLRRLAPGDFDRLNAWFQNAQINLPLNHTYVHVFRLDFHEYHCENFQGHTPYGDGSADIYTGNSRPVIKLAIASPDFATSAPTSVAVESCQANVAVTGIDLSGSFVAWVVELFEETLKRKVEGIGEVACSELESWVPTVLAGLVTNFKTQLERYEQLPPGHPLQAENTLKGLLLGTTVKLVDFAPTYGYVDRTIANYLSEGLQQLDTWLNVTVDDPNSPTGMGKDLAINNMLRQYVLGEDRCLSFSLSELPAGVDGTLWASHNTLTETTISLTGIKICGLDTFTQFDSMNPIGQFTMQNKFQLEYLTMEMDITFDMKASTLPNSTISDPDPQSVVENIQIRFGVDQVALDLSLLLAVDQNKLFDLELGSLLQSKNLLGCLMSMLHDLQVSGLTASVQKIREPVLQGFVSPGLDRVVSTLVEIAFQAYEPTLFRALPGFFRGPVRDLSNQLLRKLVVTSVCPSVLAQHAYVDFRELMLSPDQSSQLGGTGDGRYGDVAALLFNIVKDQFYELNADGMPKINDMIRILTNAQSGVPGRKSFRMDRHVLGAQVYVGDIDAAFHFRILDPYIDNLDTIGSPLSLLDPVSSEAYILNNSAGIGVDKPLRLGTRFMFELIGYGLDISNELEVNFDLHSVSLMLTALLKVAGTRFASFPLRDVVNADCWLSLMPAPALDEYGIRRAGVRPSLSLADIDVAVQRMNLNVSCVNCINPDVVELTELLRTGDAAQAATDVANKLLDSVVTLLGGKFLQVLIDRRLNEAPKRCPHNPLYDRYSVSTPYDSESPSSLSFFALLAIAIGVLLVIILGVTLFVKIMAVRRNRKWLRTVPTDQLLRLWYRLTIERNLERRRNETEALFRCPQIPWWVRVVTPFVILGSIGFFLSGHLSLGASVNIVATFTDQEFSVSNSYEFSMAQSTIEIWNAGGRALALLILIFSGVWPYAKQIITLFLWFAPSRWVSVTTRGKILLWLDALAKWSMVEIFVLVVTVAGFRVSVQSPDVPFLPDDFYSLDLLVVPMWGLYANMIAQLISQLSSHYIIHYHRKVVGSVEDTLERDMPLKPRPSLDDDEQTGALSPPSGNGESQSQAAEQPEVKLCSYAFSQPHLGETDKLVVRRLVNPLMLLFSIAMCALVVVGCVVPSFSIEVLGIVGVLVESGQFSSAVNQYSLFTMIEMLFEQAAFTGRPADYVGFGCLSALLVISVFIVPFFLVALLLFQWFRSVSESRRRHMERVVEILHAWQYTEVYLLAALVASWQLRQVSDFMNNEYCGRFDPSFKAMVYYGILDERDAHCFRVESSVEQGLYVLFAAAVLLVLVTTFVGSAVAQYFLDNDLASKKLLLDCMTDEIDNIDVVRNQIIPTPVLFTDRFRWLLLREDGSWPRTRATSQSNESVMTPADSAISILESDDWYGAKDQLAYGWSEDESGCYLEDTLPALFEFSGDRSVSEESEGQRESEI